MSAPWYRKAFGPHYPDVYAHRDDSEAELSADLLASHVTLRGARVLDVACGAGRHLTALRRRGAEACGIDLSADLLRKATGASPVARADMRALPFRSGRFDGALNMFTSFGYFSREEEDARVIAEVARVLRPGGWFLLDYLNPARTVDTLVPEGERRVGDLTARERRRYDETRRILTKEVELIDGEGRRREQWTEELRLYGPEELERMLASHRLKIEGRFGDYQGGRFDRSAPRLILLCARAGRPQGGGE